MTMSTLLTSEPRSESSSPTISLRQIIPHYNQRAVIAGQTGSGKTTLAEHILRHYAFVVVLDTKRLIRWKGFERHESLDTLQQSQATHLIYAPTFDQLWVSPEERRRGVIFNPHIESFFAWVYERQNTMLYVDEGAQVTRGEMMPRFYAAIIMQGRELGIGCITSMQRPIFIPQIILSEAHFYYIFRLQMSQDLAKIESIAGQMLPMVRGHAFAFIRVGSDEPPSSMMLTKVEQ